MCFCATASFAAGGGLAVVGAASVSIAKKDARLLAFIPLLFGIQQLIEGGQWIVPHPSEQSLLLGYAYLFFAFLIWPILIPMAVYRLEKNPWRKQLLKWFVAAGAVTTFGLMVTLYTQPLVIHILPKGIDYHVWPPLTGFSIFWYVATVCGSLLVSSEKRIRWLGLAVLLSSAFTIWIFLETFTSVWCFFAAIFSAWIYLFLFAFNKNRTKRISS